MVGAARGHPVRRSRIAETLTGKCVGFSSDRVHSLPNPFGFRGVLAALRRSVRLRSAGRGVLELVGPHGRFQPQEGCRASQKEQHDWNNFERRHLGEERVDGGEAHLYTLEPARSVIAKDRAIPETLQS